MTLIAQPQASESRTLELGHEGTLETITFIVVKHIASWRVMRLVMKLLRTVDIGAFMKIGVTFPSYDSATLECHSNLDPQNPRGLRRIGAQLRKFKSEITRYTNVNINTISPLKCHLPRSFFKFITSYPCCHLWLRG